MESNKIDQLLETYFEGGTSLEEEALLQNYFTNQKVADHLLEYKPIFVGLSAARKEVTNRNFKLEDKKVSKTVKTWWYAAASIVVVAFGIGNFYLSQSQLSQEEKEALVAFENSKNAMLLLSKNLNKGTQQLSLVDQFTIAKDRVWKEQ